MIQHRITVEESTLRRIQTGQQKAVVAPLGRDYQAGDSLRILPASPKKEWVPAGRDKRGRFRADGWKNVEALAIVTHVSLFLAREGIAQNSVILSFDHIEED